MITNTLVQNGLITRAGATPFQLRFQADDLALPFAGTIVVPNSVPVIPEPDQVVIDRMKSQNMHDWQFLSFRRPRRNKAAVGDPVEPNEKVFPYLRGPDNRPFRIVSDKLIFFVEKDYSPLDDLQFSNLFTDVGDVYSPRYKQNVTLSSRPKVLLIALESQATLNASLIPPLTRDAGTRMKGSNPLDAALGPLRDGLAGGELRGTIYAFDLGGHQIETMSALTALGIPRNHITEDPESDHPDDKPSAVKLYMQFVNIHGDPLSPYDLPLVAMDITPMPLPIEDQGDLHICQVDMAAANYKIKFEKRTLAGVPETDHYKYNFAHVGLWPGSGSRLQRVAEASPVVFNLIQDLEQSAEVPQFVRFCVFNAADEFQTEAGGAVDDKGDFAANKFKLFTADNKVTVFNSGDDYFTDVAKELTAAPGEDVQAVYLTNWSTQAHLLMKGLMSAYEIAPNDSDTAAVERVLSQQVNAPGKMVVAPLDPASDPEGSPPSEDSGFILLTRREADRMQVDQSFQAVVKSTATTQNPSAGETHRGFVRPHSLCAARLAAENGNPRAHQVTASWKNSMGDVSLVTHNLTLPAKVSPPLRFPEGAVQLDIDGGDPPRATLLRNGTYAQFVDLLKAQDPTFSDAGKDLQLLVLHLKAGRYEFIPLNTPDSLLRTFDKLFATDPLAVAVVNRRPEAEQDFGTDLITRFRELEYSDDEFQTGNVPLSSDEWGGMLRQIIAAKPADKSPVKALYWENYLANLDPNRDLARGINNCAALTAAINRTVNGKRGYAIRDRATRPFGSFHQKATVIVKRINDVLPKTKVIAYLGGMDMAFGRWDREEHHRLDPERQSGRGWHDVQVKIEGEGALDVLRNFKQRWEALGQLLDLPDTGPASSCRPVNVAQDLNTALKSSIPIPSSDLYSPGAGPFVQITRTIPPNSCYHKGLTGDKRFVGEEGELGSYESYLRAIRNARKFILIHDQYFFGIEVARAIHEALLDPKGPEFAIIVMPKDLAESDKIDPLIYKIRQRSLHALLYGADPKGGVSVPKNLPQEFVIRTPENGVSVADKVVILSPINRSGDEIYVHSKHIVVDDVFMSIGSANHTYRGTTYEIEINAAMLGNRLNRGGTDVVRSQRVELCRRMLGLPHSYGPLLQDPQAAFQLFKALELESGLNATLGETRAPSFSLHPLKPMVKKVDPVYAKRVVTDTAYNESVGFVMAMSNNSPGLDFIGRNVLENDGRDREHDTVAGLTAFLSISLELAGITLGGFSKNSPTAYARVTFDFSAGAEAAIQGRLSGGELTFLDVTLIYGAMPGETPEEVPDPLHIHNYPIKVSPLGGLEIDGLEANELLVPISTTRPVTVQATVTDSEVVPALGCKGSRLFDPTAEGTTVLPGSFTAATIEVEETAQGEGMTGRQWRRLVHSV